MPLKAGWALTVKAPAFLLLTNSHSELVANIHSTMANEDASTARREERWKVHITRYLR